MPAHPAPPAASRRLRWLSVGLGLGLCAAASLWFWHAPDDPHPIRAEQSLDGDGKAMLNLAAPQDQAAPADSESLNRPLAMSPDEWQALQAALADHPDKDAELRRIVSLLQAQAQARRFSTLQQAGANTAELQQLARVIDAQLPGQLARSEISAGEARLTKARLLEVLEPDPAQRAQALRDWLSAMSLRMPAAAPDPRDARYLASQAQISAAWRALPESRRDPAALARELDALRLSTYPTSPAASRPE
ncbi:hypothetical protein [Ideonella sp.]|uniref:hypothetical protein n=1 Tax=Ideonella sp. TaxID=1929293 RepID=UPI003BB5E6DC